MPDDKDDRNNPPGGPPDDGQGSASEIPDAGGNDLPGPGEGEPPRPAAGDLAKLGESGPPNPDEGRVPGGTGIDPPIALGEGGQPIGGPQAGGPATTGPIGGAAALTGPGAPIRGAAAPTGAGGVAGIGSGIAPAQTLGPAGRNIEPGGAIGAIALGVAGRPVAPGGTIGQAAVGPGSTNLAAPGLTQLATAPLAGPSEIPVGTPISSLFNIGGAPIAVLGGVFSGGLPIAGPVTQIYRGGAGPYPNTQFINTLSPGGPIEAFFIGLSGAPIGADTFAGGDLPIGPTQAVAVAAAAIQPRTALVTLVATSFGGAMIQTPAPPIGTEIAPAGAPIGGAAATAAAGAPIGV